MLKSFIYLGCIVVAALAIFVVEFPDGLMAVAILSILAGGIVLSIRKFAEDREFLTLVFLAALALRLAFGIFIDVFDLRMFFGTDGLGYHESAIHLLDVWTGREELSGVLLLQTYDTTASFWGIYYLIASIYYLFGPKIFLAQSIFAVVGAATAPMVYFCSKSIFGNVRVARFAAVSIAVFPTFIVWSSQLLKDGLIVFSLVTCMVMVLHLQKKFTYPTLAVLVFSLLAIVSLRFYVAYMAVIAVVSSFLIGISHSNRSFVRNAFVLILVGLAMVYFGVGQRATLEYEVFGNLERIQISRLDLATSGESGYGAEADVSTAGGALSTIPLGFVYLVFAPFPWDAANFRQAITIPEVLVWWALLPFMVVGLIYTMRNRLRTAFPILAFSFLLTLAYSIGQGNVGAAYRQRTQIQVFMFILIGVGWIVVREHFENQRLIRQAAQRRVDERLRANRLAPVKK